MADEKETQTLLQKLLFYTTAFFILLGTFSFFAFLFLVPFVIDPAFTTIFMQFDTRPAECVTITVESRRGVSNCSWTSCREGCTRELYYCTQILVNYKLPDNSSEQSDEKGGLEGGVEDDEKNKRMLHYERSFDEHVEKLDRNFAEDMDNGLPKPLSTGFLINDSDWYFTGAKLFPNVKGCGYPPKLNCTIFFGEYGNIGQNFSCYYSTVDPGIVITELNMWQVSILSVSDMTLIELLRNLMCIISETDLLKKEDSVSKTLTTVFGSIFVRMMKNWIPNNYKLITMTTRVIPLTDSHINNSFDLVYKLGNVVVQPNDVLLSLDVVSLFTNIPIDLVMRSIKIR
ncbi:protein tipE-like [Pseudomyrmex gracilis]|uniref:protein tipE-like n=1 Tax=Pseudomyrmex gracilis TaxID=219809 RepID=UPI000994C8F8|nr:protein tipE-like [Pseudomyrmex gracilis]